MLPTLPADIGHRLAGLCGDTFNPVRQVLADDVDTITRVLLELETLYQCQKTPEYNTEVCPDLEVMPLFICTHRQFR